MVEYGRLLTANAMRELKEIWCTYGIVTDGGVEKPNDCKCCDGIVVNLCNWTADGEVTKLIDCVVRGYSCSFFLFPFYHCQSVIQQEMGSMPGSIGSLTANHYWSVTD